jgi:5'-methylthioadenosine phosphorylase
MVRVGIIGGSGLDDPAILKDAKDESVTTRWGEPSSPLRRGTIEGVECVLLARHGRHHTLPPTHVPNRANVQALLDAGCSHLLTTTAVGSLREEIGRGDLVIVDQFIDFTRFRHTTFHDRFEPGQAAHTPMADPFSAELRALLVASAQALGIRHHAKGTVVTIEGPRFSTRAESHMFRAWGADIINMSIAPECALANEAGIPYATVAMSTDYDCWKEDEEPVTWDQIVAIFEQNVEKVVKLLVATIAKIGAR